MRVPLFSSFVFFSLFVLFSLLALLLCPQVFAQTSTPAPQGAASRTETPFLIPQTIFVGDPGRLVVPLGQAFTGLEPFVLENPEKYPETEELLIRRIELERRGGASRLLIDFIPYIPGVISFPQLEFPPGMYSGTSALTLTGLEVQVASILNPSQMALSEPASPLAVPGTSFLVYGSLALILFLLFLGIGGSLWGRRHFKHLWERIRRRHLLRLMIRFLQRLRQESFYGKVDNPGHYLSLLSGEFREFLSLFTGVNCRSLSPGEFLDISLGYEAPGEAAADTIAVQEQRSADEHLLNPAFLCRLFRNWDTLRFSGRGVDRVDLFLALKETDDFIAALDRAEKEKLFPKSITDLPAGNAVPAAEG